MDPEDFQPGTQGNMGGMNFGPNQNFKFSTSGNGGQTFTFSGSGINQEDIFKMFFGGAGKPGGAKSKSILI
jgi:hypothetical protein